MLNKIIYFLLVILFITLPLVNSHLLDFFGLENLSENFYVKWNYEFLKVIFFNIFSGFILFLYFLKNFLNKNIFIPKIIFPIIFILIISTIFSISPYNSLLWNTDKSHSLLMFLNLIWIFIILINSNYKFKKNILFWSVLWLSPVIYFAWWEFFNPSYNYWDLNNRAIWTFGHPNYLALYLLLFLPIILKNKAKLNWNINYLLIAWIVSVIVLTKSIIAISLLILYKIYYFFFRQKYKNIKNLYFIFILIWIVFFIIQNFWYSKLHSFLSRIFIWETTFNIIISDFKTIIIWNWLWTLWQIFDQFKSPFIYIFENIWFTADRPHNILLNIFYHTWVFGLIIFIYLFLRLIFKNSWTYKNAILIWLIFLCFNFASIASYLVLILFISLLYKDTTQDSPIHNIFNYLFVILITSFSIFGSYFSYNYFVEEHNIYINENHKTENFIIKKIESENIEKNIFKTNQNNHKKLCEQLIKYSSSVENYFICWDLLYIQDRKKAINYYNLWLKKLPDLWNLNSTYYNNQIIKQTISWHRFFSEKYSNLNVVLKRVWIER